MNAAVAITKICLLSITTLVLFGCTFRPHILSAHSYRVGDNEVIELGLHSREASIIKKRQIYFSVVVIDCEKNQDRFPIEPYIAGQRATEFKFPITTRDVKITGNMPVNIFVKYPHPCVFLEGGSYFFGNMKSAPILIMKAAAGRKGDGGN